MYDVFDLPFSNDLEGLAMSLFSWVGLRFIPHVGIPSYKAFNLDFLEDSENGLLALHVHIEIPYI